MSAIFGVFNRDRRPLDSAILQQMDRSISHRGPDGGAVWQDENVALGHKLLRVLPEVDGGVLPLSDAGLTLTADARLDNRDELRVELGISDFRVTDAALILAAYRRWGRDCPQHLLGDFAFAIWDGDSRALFCARDHFGVKPFYYCATQKFFVFGSEINVIFEHGDIQKYINQEKIADFLVALVPDTHSTLYSNVVRLPPHHSILVREGGEQLQAFWKLDRDALSPPNPPKDSSERFRELFEPAVHCRLVGNGPVGALLSGGLDSSSIACIARSIVARESGRSLPTFSMVFDETPAFNERPFIEAVLAQGGFLPSFLPMDECAPFHDFEHILSEQEGLFQAPGLFFTRRLYSEAAARGVRVLLDGHGGDEVVSHGYGRLHELALSSRWLSLWREIRGVSQTYDTRPWPTFRGFLRSYGPARRLTKLHRAFRTVCRLRNTASDARPSWSIHVNPDLVTRTRLDVRYRDAKRAENKAIRSERGYHAWTISSGLTPAAFETLDRSAAAAGVELRYPFWDKRLVEFCLSLPPEQKLNHGWGRYILRRAMEGILPPSIQWRRDKLDFAPHIIRGMLAQNRDLIRGVLESEAQDAANYIDFPAIRAAFQRIEEQCKNASGLDVQIVWRAVVLSLWLRGRKES